MFEKEKKNHKTILRKMEEENTEKAVQWEIDIFSYIRIRKLCIAKKKFFFKCKHSQIKYKQGGRKTAAHTTKGSNI